MSVSLQVDALGILAKWETPQEAENVAQVAKQKGWQFLQDPSGDGLHAHLLKSGRAESNTLSLNAATRALKKAKIEVS